MTHKTLYLIDGSSYIYRAYHAIRGLSNSKGFPTNSIFGFTKMILKLVEDRQPDYAAIIFDAKGPTFRHEMYEDYKANRPPMPEDLVVQIPYIKKVTEGFNIPGIEKQGFEADDLIGTLAEKAKTSGFNVVMVSGDKDLLQLISEDVVMWDPMKDQTTDMAVFKEKFGVEPPQMIDVMALSGDSSDNVPGVPGIGLKTALALIKEFGSLENIYDRIDEITRKKQKENLTQYKDQALLSRSLVRIETGIPTVFEPESFKLGQPDKTVLSELFKELEFKQLQELFFDAEKKPEKKNYQAIYDEDALDELVERLASAKIFAVDTETTSEKPMEAGLVGISVSITPGEAFYIPCGHFYIGAPDQLPVSMVLDKLRPVLENPDILKIGQNIKYDWIVLSRHGVNLEGVAFDTMIASYVLNPSKRGHSLDQMALDFLNYKTVTFKEVAGNSKTGFAEVTLDKGVFYACEDADITFELYRLLKPMLEEKHLFALFETIEMPLVRTLTEMELTGICVDAEKLQELSKRYEHQLKMIEKDIYAAAGEAFNIKSSQQLGAILFEKLQLPTQKKTKKKTGYSTDVDVLTTLAMHHELPALVLQHRSLSKLKSTYTDALFNLINPKTHRIHTSFNQTITATGRLSSSEPNLQNIPIREEAGREIRSAFVPQKGWKLICADYSQIELRILAHYAKDEIFIRSFVDDEDIHLRTAAEIFELNPDDISPELRRQAKAINFGIIYGMSAFGLSQQLGITRKMAQTYIDHYFNRYKGVANFIREIVETVRKTKMTSTLLGRIRYLPDIDSSNRNVRQFAERMAVNTPIQGTAADFIKLAMIEVAAILKRKKMKTAMLLSVHDELIFEAPPDELDEVSIDIQTAMESVYRLDVPLKVNLNSGGNWSEAH